MRAKTMRTRVFENESYRLFKGKQTVRKIVGRLARKINNDYQNCPRPPILLFVLTGGLYFGVDLSKKLDEFGLEHAVDTIGLKRYSANEVPGQVEIVSRPHADFGGRDVVIVEDLVDEGPTMNFLNTYLITLPSPPRSIEYCLLGLRQMHGPLKFTIKYLGFDVPDGWLVGYGMDSQQGYRGLQDIWIKNIE